MCSHILKAVDQILASGVVIQPTGYDSELTLQCEYCDSDEVFVEGIGGGFGFNPITEEDENV